MLLSTPHAHTQFCDGKSTADEMARAACALGFASLGFSSHGRQYFELRYAMDEARERAYIAHVRALQSRYAGRLRIWLGVESDLFTSGGCDAYDYVLAAVHYLPDPAQAAFVSVDGGAKRLLDFRDRAFHGDGEALARAFYALTAACALAKRPQIMAHFDILRRNNADGALYDEDSRACRRAALEALEAVRQSGAALEVNTGGMARYGMPAPYPAGYLLSAWREMGGDVILGSDCHDARLLDFGYAEAARLLRGIGFESALVLGRGDTLFERTELA